MQVAVDIGSEVLVQPLLVVCAVNDTFSRAVPVDFVFSWSMVFRNVIPDITILGRLFVFSQCSFQVSASLPNISSLTVNTFDSAWSFSLMLISMCCKVVIVGGLHGCRKVVYT